MSMFDMLNDEALDDEPIEDNSAHVESDPVNIKRTNEPTASLGKKGKAKKSKKKLTTEEELEIEAVLAELQGESPRPLKDSTQEQPNSVPDRITTEDSERKENENTDNAAESVSTVKTAAQKKKEKKERQALQKKLERQKQLASKERGDTAPTPVIEKTAEPNRDAVVPETTQEVEAIEEDVSANASVDVANDEGETAKDKKKKKKDKKKGAADKATEERKKKPKGMAALIKQQQELMRQQQEEMERKQREEEERLERLRLEREERERLEKERKEKRKMKEKAKKSREKAAGITDKVKRERRRLQEELDKGLIQISAPSSAAGSKPKRIVYEDKRKLAKKKQQQQQAQDTETSTDIAKDKEPQIPPVNDDADMKEPLQRSETATPEVKSSDEDDKAWDASSSDEEDLKDTKVDGAPAEKAAARIDGVDHPGEPKKASDDEAGKDEEEEESSEESESSEEDSSEEEEEELSPKEKALLRMQKRKDHAERNKSVEVLRSPVVCVLGHVDTGKTKLLDKLRKTHVQDGEAGGITQQIGATNVPAEAIKQNTSMCKDFSKSELKIPGLMIIDTPGHESFSNLRSRGTNLCDIAILVVDIMHGLEQQTIESIQLLKDRRTPFVVALNKIDRLNNWQSNPKADIVNTLKRQQPSTKAHFDELAQAVLVQFAEQGLNAALFHENKKPREYISMVPTSAGTGDGMGNLLALICDLSQKYLPERLAFSEELQATVMEVKEIHGHGTTIDVILVNGRLHVGDTIVIAGMEGPIVTTIKTLLMPHPMKELRVKCPFDQPKEICGAVGTKIAAKDLEKALAGLPLFVAQQQDEIPILKEEVETQLKNVLSAIKTKSEGVYVQASTLGSLEALLEFLRTSKIPYFSINIGPVHKKDVMKASAMLDKDPQWAVILAFDVKVEHEAQQLADSLGVLIFTADIIYHLFDRFIEHSENLKRKKQEELKNVAVFPCKLRILPQYIFNTRDPIVMGVTVTAGFLREGTPLCVPSKEGIVLGKVTSIENNHKPVDEAREGSEICIKIENTSGDAPKMFGRHFDENDVLVSKISRSSIDAVKDWFRDDMKTSDWKLMIELKKLLEIL